MCRLSFLAAHHESNTMKRRHILTQRRFILMPNIAWASERRGKGWQIRRSTTMSFLLADGGTGWPRITSCDLNHAALAMLVAKILW